MATSRSGARAARPASAPSAEGTSASVAEPRSSSARSLIAGWIGVESGPRKQPILGAEALRNSHSVKRSVP